MGSGHNVWSQIWIMSHIHQVQIPDCEHTLLQDSNLKPAFKGDFTHCMLRSFTMTCDLQPFPSHTDAEIHCFGLAQL